MHCCTQILKPKYQILKFNKTKQIPLPILSYVIPKDKPNLEAENNHGSLVCANIIDYSSTDVHTGLQGTTGPTVITEQRNSEQDGSA
jgi:hypothetical protein